MSSATDQLQTVLDRNSESVVLFLFSKLELEPEKEEQLKTQLTKKFGIFSSKSKKEKTEDKAENGVEKPSTKKKAAKKEEKEKHACSKMITPKSSKEPKQCSKQGTMEKNGKWFCKTHFDKEVKSDVSTEIKKEAESDDEPEKEEEVEKVPEKKEAKSKIILNKAVDLEKVGDYNCIKGTRIALNKDMKAIGTVAENKTLKNGVISDNDKKMLRANNIEVAEVDDDL
jgi:hypothetical protein